MEGAERRYRTIITNNVDLITIRKGDLSRPRERNDLKNTRSEGVKKLQDILH